MLLEKINMKKFLYSLYYPFTKEGLEAQRIQMIQSKCKHERWNCDKQIRVIECKECGKRAWIDDYVDLYKNTK